MRFRMSPVVYGLIVTSLLPAVLGTSCADVPGTNGPIQGDVSGIYVTNANNTVLVFALDASGNAVPKRVIAGPDTGLNLPIGIAKDKESNIYVCNRKGPAVTVYPITASGNVAPSRTLSDPNMKSPQGIVIGPADDVFVCTCPSCGTANGGQTGVFHFEKGSTDSDFVIGGFSNNNTGFTVPVGVGLDETRNLYVANAFGGNVSVFAPGVMGDQLPIRSATPGGNTQFIAYGNNAVFLAAPGAGITEYPSTLLGPSTPSGTLSFTDLSYPAQFVVDTAVTPPVVYIADYGGDAIHIVQTEGIAPFLTVKSVTTIKGQLTLLDAPLGIMIAK